MNDKSDKSNKDKETWKLLDPVYVGCLLECYYLERRREAPKGIKDTKFG